MLRLGEKKLELPLIQGGMGVGVSLGKLAGAVAKCGGMGVISSVNAGYAEEDFDAHPVEANLRALKREIRRAKELSGGRGLIGVNIMTAVSHYEETCLAAIEAGADAIISGAGLPMSLPGLTGNSGCLYAPIVSGGRAARLLLKQYQRHYQSRPDFIVLEGALAGGHLGFSEEELLKGQARNNEAILEEVLKEAGELPVFVAGGVFDKEDIRHFLTLGAAGVQIGTRFIATEECDASAGFKEAILRAKQEDIVITKSPVGMPARALNSPLLKRLAAGEHFGAISCNGCLKACPKGDKTPYCISRALIAAVQGDWENGLFFTGANAPRITEITTVEKLIKELAEGFSVQV